MSSHFKVLAYISDEALDKLALLILDNYPASKITLLNEPKAGLVMLRMREGVANSQFNAGEILVTEARIELDGQFGYGMVLGDNPRRALAVALVDAALSINNKLSRVLQQALDGLKQEIAEVRQREFAATSLSKVNFEVF